MINTDPLELTKHDFEKYHQVLNQRPDAAVISRAVMTNGINAAATDPAAKVRLHREFSVEVDTGTVTNQKQSGRCWEFSLLNTLRHQFEKQHNVKNFELSQNYLFFWDKVERANMFYQHIIETADKGPNDREVAFYLKMAGGDGGQWAMAAALVQKYGVMPAYAMPETYNTDHTMAFATTLALKMRRDAVALRQMVADGASADALNEKRHELVGEVYRMAAYSFGEPPATFDLEYRDNDKKLHREAGLTPQAFYQQQFDVDLDDYVVVTNSPDKPLNELYRLASQENVAGGKQIRFLNVDMAELKRTAIAQLQDGETVWFGNDVLQQMSREQGFLDAKLYRKSELFGIDLSLSKADRFAYHEAEVTHAMTLTGVNLVEGKPNRWKVENSWGEKNGEKGYFVMTDDWMDQFVYEVVVHKKYLTEEQKNILKHKPVELKPWDPLM
ncbi:C1 family peptidase [Secundilactobacillus folii]|uniref:Aminopeptidase n=1 Tax=Secundilactobacillus folii TaxID=2678357 RepID=A0A7X2XTR7_9LACO|nr:C1 family peptidase [Secundilactobacillus folii]MTV81414.1 aminopeptidase [Secundilactobacillus folii]